MRHAPLWLLLLAVAAAPANGRAQQAATRSPHGDLPSSLKCGDCHTVDGWKPRLQGFDHDTATEFTLVGRHREVPCSLCHLDARFDEPRARVEECGLCHLDVHQGALSDDCVQCHSMTRFSDVRGLAIHARTSFPLSGAHMQVTCDACHPGDERGVFVTRDIECVSCHEADYRSAQSIDHVTTGFPVTCEQCHTTLGWWHAVQFDHVMASGGFPLLGRHAEIRCESCHDPVTLAPKFPTNDPNDCYTCHTEDYEQEHGGSFPTTCGDCHTVFGWEGASVDHSLLGFPLEGAHQNLECTACHQVPGYALLFPPPSTPDDCIACHQDDYQREHGGSGFPTTCLLCHNRQSWGNASFADHDAQFFPISSGPHRNKWTGCETCHTTPANYTAFSCFACHEHDQPQMDDKHSEVSGYAYSSTACYSCHPNGRKED